MFKINTELKSGVLLLSFILYPLILFSQADEWDNYQHRLLQVSLLPAISSNGIQPGSYINHFSFNLTSGYSGGNKGIEIGIISNLNESVTRGFSFAGLANITGANAFARMDRKEIKDKINTGFEANLVGGQFSGLINLVTTNVFGGQLSGGFNISRNALFGLQIAGLTNTVKAYSFGVQIAGIANSSVKAMDGVQISAGLNFTTGQLQGAQIGAINWSGLIEGKNSTRTNTQTGLQLGLFNRANWMNGFQIGLINIGGQMQGTQIGLINIFRGGKEVGTKDGTAIGLLNIGDTYNIKIYTNELFATNYALVTGIGKDYRFRTKPTISYVLNEVIFGYNPNLIKSDGKVWSIGYGLTYALYNRSTVPGQMQKKFIEISTQIHHYQAEDKITDLNLFAKANANVGMRVHPKLSSIYVFGGLSYNRFLNNSSIEIQKLTEKSEPAPDAEWLGYQVGIMMH